MATTRQALTPESVLEQIACLRNDMLMRRDLQSFVNVGPHGAIVGAWWECGTQVYRHEVVVDFRAPRSAFLMAQLDALNYCFRVVTRLWAAHMGLRSDDGLCEGR